jgi:hypothetical protein
MNNWSSMNPLIFLWALILMLFGAFCGFTAGFYTGE